jgi:hypothetical protein
MVVVAILSSDGTGGRTGRVADNTATSLVATGSYQVTRARSVLLVAAATPNRQL